MILPITQYGHPALRSKGRRIDAIDARIRKLSEDMIETMYDADGVGLAAQQVGLPLQVCVIDVSDAEEPGSLTVAGEAMDVADFMPMVLINPEVETLGETAFATEGCLSFPGVKGEIARPASVRVKALSLDGGTIEFEADGLLARAVQHENDHLQGILFIDRMELPLREELSPRINRIMERNAGL